MGCIYAKRRKEALRKGLDITSNSHRKKTYLKNVNQCDGSPQQSRGLTEPAPEFTDRQRELVVQTWGIIQEDMARVGVVMFMKLFETHPDVQDVFMPFKGQSKEDLKHSSQLKAHALRVMNTVEKCLGRMNEPAKLQEMLHDLGTRHVMYSAKVDYIDLIGPQFIWAIQSSVGDQWTPEVEQAWSDLFKLISHYMKAAMVF
ncbi:uncharacterized protein LOC132551816 [Ylistrum balloti]|uniref:uncharacterized protein LOC132551816 n=1 Tax=Ylistrum balloti TaxID=509963 RepID=UPI002905E47F|nr:uncharacterized protein LOC132551816 [Ylistrum balloti]